MQVHFPKETILKFSHPTVLAPELTNDMSVLKRAFDQFCGMDVLGNLQNIMEETPVVLNIICTNEINKQILYLKLSQRKFVKMSF